MSLWIDKDLKIMKRKEKCIFILQTIVEEIPRTNSAIWFEALEKIKP